MGEDAASNRPVAADEGTAPVIGLILARPKRLAGLARGFGGSYLAFGVARIVCAKDGDIRGQFRIFQ